MVTPITNIINYSLKEGSFPNCFKTAYVTPLLKKPNLDRNLLKNYRPVSNLSFLSKLIEKVAAKQLNNYIDSKGLSNVNQSAYRRLHSTESALLKIQNDIAASLDSGKAVALTLLDLSAAFDTIDHDILFNSLRDWFGVDGTVLRWIRSYLSNRKQKVKLGNSFSDVFSLPYGVPQGSVLKLHWLPITYRILFKYNLITFKAINFSQPIYLSSLIKTSCLTRGNRLSLSSASHKKAIGRRGFAVASPIEWNRLPQSVRSQQTITGFRSQLKTYLFRLAYPPP